MNLKGKELDETPYVHGSKNTNAHIHGFIWAHTDEVLIVTDQGAELVQVTSLLKFYFYLFKKKFIFFY